MRPKSLTKAPIQNRSLSLSTLRRLPGTSPKCRELLNIERRCLRSIGEELSELVDARLKTLKFSGRLLAIFSEVLELVRNRIRSHVRVDILRRNSNAQTFVCQLF